MVKYFVKSVGTLRNGGGGGVRIYIVSHQVHFKFRVYTTTQHNQVSIDQEIKQSIASENYNASLCQGQPVFEIKVLFCAPSGRTDS